jgi:hypothetical protein
MQIKFQPDSRSYDVRRVVVDGEHVLDVRRRSAIVRDGIYLMFDVTRAGESMSGSEQRLVTDTTRKRAVAEALALIGMDEAARKVDRDRADHVIGRRGGGVAA